MVSRHWLERRPYRDYELNPFEPPRTIRRGLSRRVRSVVDAVPRRRVAVHLEEARRRVEDVARRAESTLRRADARGLRDRRIAELGGRIDAFCRVRSGRVVAARR